MVGSSPLHYCVFQGLFSAVSLVSRTSCVRRFVLTFFPSESLPMPSGGELERGRATGCRPNPFTGNG